jgi:hypothetical protein
LIDIDQFILQRRRKLDVPVRDLKFLANRPELFHRRLGQVALKPGFAFAAENSTAGEPVRIDRAFAVELIWTSPRRHLPEISSAELIGKIQHLGCRDIQPVAVYSEVAAFAADLAITGGGSAPDTLAVKPFINITHRQDNFFIPLHPATSFR